jgi:hypothetical protein
MTVLSGNRAAERFAGLLEGRADPAGPEFRPLLATVAQLRAVPPPPAPDEFFRVALRERLLAAAPAGASSAAQAAAPVFGTARPAAVPPTDRLRDAVGRWLVSGRPARPRATAGTRIGRRAPAFAAGLAALAVAVTGIGVSASRSVPGDLFYGLKRATESVQLFFASGDLAKGRLELEFAQTRLHEVAELTNSPGALTGSGGPGSQAAGGSTAANNALAGPIDSALQAMASEIRAGSRDLLDYYASHRQPEALRLLVRFSVQQRAGLLAELPLLPPASRRQAVTAITVVSRVGSQARVMLTHAGCAGCSQSGSGHGRTGGPTVAPSPGSPTSPSAGTGGGRQPLGGTSTSPGVGLLPSGSGSGGSPGPGEPNGAGRGNHSHSPLPWPSGVPDPLPSGGLPSGGLSSLPVHHHHIHLP